jgi:hypothetical protein
MLIDIRDFAKENIEVLGVLIGSLIQYMLLYKNKRNKINFYLLLQYLVFLPHCLS